MLTVQDFVEKYEKYPDEELYQINATIADYAAEAKEALEIVLNARGGLEPIAKQIKEKKAINDEIKRITKEAGRLSGGGTDASFLKTLIKSDLLPEKDVQQIIAARFELETAALNDKSVTSRTILGSAVGCVIASATGGVLWGLQLIYSQRIFYILGAALVMLCYGIIKFATKQSAKNKAVFVATIIAVVISLAIGQVMYEVIGYRQ